MSTRLVFAFLGLPLALSACAWGGSSDNRDGGDASVTIPVQVQEYGQVCVDRQSGAEMCYINQPTVVGAGCFCILPTAYGPRQVSGRVTQ